MHLLGFQEFLRKHVYIAHKSSLHVIERDLFVGYLTETGIHYFD